MSRSRRHTPIFGYTLAESEKAFKQIENRRRRAAERAGAEYVPAAYGPKDGRKWIANPEPKLMRK